MKASYVWKFLRGFCRIVATVVFDLKVWGLENIPENGGVLLVANHQSFLDPIIIAVRLRRPVSYMARSGLFENPFLSWLIRSLHAFPVRQGEGDLGAIKESIRRLRDGHVLNIYPEGSRTETGELGPIEPGVSLIVRRAGVPIVPVAIDGSFAAWPHNRKLFRPHPICLLFGPPMIVNGLKSEEIIALIEKTLRSLLVELREKQAKEMSR
jgi:1-acyl-sn-glycerol-3-phosphate acyltransferase